MTSPRYIDPASSRASIHGFAWWTMQAAYTIEHDPAKRLPYRVFEHSHEGGRQYRLAFSTFNKAIHYVVEDCP